jgi:N-acetylglutamate synthase-like GNAT family acetyltransferase
MQQRLHPNIVIGSPTADEYAEILPLLAAFALDDADLDPRQFLVARRDGRMAGFARTRTFDGFIEFCSLGVVHGYRNAGVGSLLVQEQIRRHPGDVVFIATVIPDYFVRFGFESVEDFPAQLRSKIERCGTLCHAQPVTVMKLTRHHQDTPGSDSRPA